MRIIILLLFGFLSSSLSFADPIPEQIPHVIILHINGVNTAIDEAVKNLEALEALEDISNIKSNIIKWDLLWNATHGLLTSDIWEVMKMKKQEAQNLTIDDYVLTYMKRYGLDYPINSENYNALKERIKQEYMDDADTRGKNLPDLLGQLSSKVGSRYDYNAYILLLLHSQGNQYANQLWKYLINNDEFTQSNLAIFGIASPTDHMEGNVKPIPSTSQVNYYTADNDYVINSLSVLTHFIPQTNLPMRGNMHLNECSDLLCHNLIGSYLTDEHSRELISNQIHSFLFAVKKNLIEEQFDKNINLLFWMDDKVSSFATLRSESGKVICANGKCDENINYLDTNLSKFDPYKDYKWSTDWHIGKEYLLLVPYSKIQSMMGDSSKDYFFIRGSYITNVIDSFNVGCSYNRRNTKKIETLSQSPFYGKPYGTIGTDIYNGCKIPDYMLTDNKTKVILGAFI